MLTATRTAFWKGDYDLSLGGLPLTRWNARTWRSGGAFTLDGRRYEIRVTGWGTRYELTDQTGVPVATAERVGRKRWSVQAHGRTYAFRRASFWKQEEHLLDGGQPVGVVRRTRPFRGDAEADLPGLPRPVQVFAFLVVLSAWDAAAAAAG